MLLNTTDAVLGFCSALLRVDPMPALRARIAAVDAPAGITIEVAYLGACGDLLTRQSVPDRPLDKGLLVDHASGALILFRVAGRSHTAAG